MLQALHHHALGACRRTELHDLRVVPACSDASCIREDGQECRVPLYPHRFRVRQAGGPTAVPQGVTVGVTDRREMRLMYCGRRLGRSARLGASPDDLGTSTGDGEQRPCWTGCSSSPIEKCENPSNDGGRVIDLVWRNACYGAERARAAPGCACLLAGFCRRWP
jgi:hypothetical protein